MSPAFEAGAAVAAATGGHGVSSDVERKNHAFMELLDDIEARFPVDEWMSGGVRVWPIARLHLYYSFFDFQYFAQEPVRAGVIRLRDVTRLVSRVAGSLGRYAAATMADMRNCRRADRHYDAVVLNYQTYMTKLNGAWYSRICDPFVEGLSEHGWSSLMLTGGYRYAVPRHTPSKFIQPQLVWSRMRGMTGATDDDDRAFGPLAELETFVRRSHLFGDGFALAGPVARHSRQIRGISRYFGRLLRAVRPRAVFVTCWYATESMACVLACNELGIPSIDIQHGTQGFHVGYVRWNRVPAEGFELLPTHFWCWSETEAAAIREWSCRLPLHQPVVGGNLFLARWIGGDDPTVRSYDAQLEDLKRRSGAQQHILFTLNGCTKNELDLLAGIIAAVNASGLRAFFWVRLHPIALDQKEAVRRVLQQRGLSNADVDRATSLPLYALLRHMDVHVTEFSSAVIEASAFGVPSVIGELGTVGFPEQIAAGWAVPARSLPEWVDTIHLQLRRRDRLRDRRPEAAPPRKALDQLLQAIGTRNSAVL